MIWQNTSLADDQATTLWLISRKEYRKMESGNYLVISKLEG